MSGTEQVGAKATAIRRTVQKTGDRAVYQAQEHGRGQREDAPRLEHPVRGRKKNWWNKWHTPQTSQARASGERGPRTGGKQPQTPSKRKGAERHVGGTADTVTAG